MKVYALWFGGSSYVWGDDSDIEVFDSIRAARDRFADRYECQSWHHHFEFINREPEDSLCPVVESNTEMWLFFENPTGWGDKYPDRIIKVGRRDGILVERV